MKRIGFRLLKKKTVQNSAQTSFAASAAVPDSGFAFVNNSQGASAALSEFITAFSTVLDNIDLEGLARSNDKFPQPRWYTIDDSDEGPFGAQLRLLEDTAAEYSNSTIELSEDICDWNA